MHIHNASIIVGSRFECRRVHGVASSRPLRLAALLRNIILPQVWAPGPVKISCSTISTLIRRYTLLQSCVAVRHDSKSLRPPAPSAA